MKEYNNRKKMFKEYNIDLVINNDEEFNTQVIKLLNNLDIWRTDWVMIEPLAVSFGTYGANGVVLNLMDEFTGAADIVVAIKGRTTELFKRMHGVSRVND